MATPNTTVNYEDERFGTVEADKKTALSEAEKTYGGMISESDKFYNAQIDASKQWADEQTELQQERSDFAIEQIEQQKEQAKKDYTKEQSGAWVDYQKESNRYGANAEQMAAGGFGNTGYSESSQVNLYNTYQQRVASAKEAYNQALLNYNNAIKDARLQNNSALAEIAFNALKEQLALGLEGFQYKNELILEKANKKTELDQMYYGRYLDVLQQINTENAMAEDIRRYDKDYTLREKEYEEGIRQFDEEIKRLKELDAQEMRQFNIENGITDGSSDNGGDIINKPKSSGNFLKTISDIASNAVGMVKNTANKSTKVEPTPNMESVNALGYGLISASELDRLVRSGEVIEYVKNGQLYYKKA